MSQEKDYADNQVEGLARFLPTTLSKSLAVAVFAAPLSVFVTIREKQSWFGLERFTQIEQTLIAGIISVLVALALCIFLSLELAYLVSKSKHRRMVHYSAAHPILSFKWLGANLQYIHWLVLLLLSSLMFLVGYYVGRT